MTLVLTHMTDLQRVRIALSGYDVLGINSVRIERSLNQTLWMTLRGGVELPIDGAGEAVLDDYEWFDSVTNHYRVVEVDPGPENTVESDSITPSLSGDVWLKSIRYPLLNRAIEVLHAEPGITRVSRSTSFPVSGRSTGVAQSDLRNAQAFTLAVLLSGATVLENARDLDLSLASGDTFFVHIPDGSRVPGGYVVIGDSEQVPQHAATDAHQIVTLPCQVVTPPSPLVVGKTLTWGTVRRLYGDWTALVAANPTWRDLLDDVGDPADLVVI